MKNACNSVFLDAMTDMSARNIKGWLAINGLRQVDIAQDIGVSPSMIHRFVTGQSFSARILEHFLSIGCPKEYFAWREISTSRKVA